MQRSVTICAYNRPSYLRHVLLSLLIAMRECPEWGLSKPHIVISVDPGGSEYKEVIAIADQWIQSVSNFLKPELIAWPEHLGVSEHPRRLLQYMFMERQTEFNVHLEDDTVLSPDALRGAEWFRKQHSPVDNSQCSGPMHNVIGLSLWASSRAADAETVATNQLRYKPDFGAWGWACTYLSWWLWFSHYWNYKREQPIGFDWSASRMMQEHGLYMIEPALSRVRNIGRENGEHQTPQQFDVDMEGHIYATLNTMTAIDDFQLTGDQTSVKRAPWTLGK